MAVTLINLPMENDHLPLLRVLTCPRFNLGVGPWTVQPMWNERRRGYGFYVESFSRTCLPAIGEAELTYKFGIIDGDLVGASQPSDVSRIAGIGWDPNLDTASAPDLHWFEIRIQAAPFVENDADADWRTVWWGQCELQTDAAWPGAKYPAGTRTYHCVDGLARTRYWMMNRHGAYINGTLFANMYGHPGYNVGHDGLVIGNRDAAGNVYKPQPDIPDLDGKTYCHIYQGTTVLSNNAAITWTDLQACEHALRITRPLGEPLFSFVGDTSLLSAIALPWPVDEGDSVFDFLSNVCRRERGRGVVFTDWADDSLDPTGTLTVRLGIKGQYAAPYSGVTDPTNATPIVVPASSDPVTVDLIGDHRLITSAFSLSDAGLYRADAVESFGDWIELLATLSFADVGADGLTAVAIQKGWNESVEPTFAALDPIRRTEESWRFVWTMYRLPLDWQGSLGNGNSGGNYRSDFACGDDGIITIDENKPQSSPLLTKILPDLPIYEGFLYNTATPTRRDLTTAVGLPIRRAPLLLLRLDDDSYINADIIGLSLHVIPNGIQISSPLDNQGGRLITDGTGNFGSAFTLDAISATVGIQLPNRVRMRTLRAGLTNSDVRRTNRIQHPEIKYWISSSGAIWDRDCELINQAPAPGRRNSGQSSAGIAGSLRDDRRRLAQLHALACAWYLQDRRSAKWSLRACGFLDSFDNVSSDSHTGASVTTAIPYPKLGQMVTDLNASGQTFTVNTPITWISYSQRDGVTQWTTDWQDRDFT